MRQILTLLLPALIPSWNFFDVIAASPRIEFTILMSADEKPTQWLEFRPRPARVSLLQMLGRMLWNPLWNESLFMVSCAERLIEQPTRYCEDEIFKRIEADLRCDTKNIVTAMYLQFRLQLVWREEIRLRRETVFLSRIGHISGTVGQAGPA